jgi:hypothetical protein
MVNRKLLHDIIEEGKNKERRTDDEFSKFTDKMKEFGSRNSINQKIIGKQEITEKEEAIDRNPEKTKREKLILSQIASTQVSMTKIPS